MGARPGNAFFGRCLFSAILCRHSEVPNGANPGNRVAHHYTGRVGRNAGMKTEGMTEEEINKRHAEKMAKKKAARNKMIATKTEEKGLLMVHTGKGKGKTTAAMGLAA